MEGTKIIFIYGAPAVGKLTTAQILAERIDYKLFHNHLTVDLVRSIFDRGNASGDMLIALLRLEILEVAVKEHIKGIVMTGAYAHNFVYPNGENDEWFVKQLESITNKNGGKFYGINLVANKEKLLHRAEQESRRKYMKITKGSVLEELLGKYDFTKTAPIKNNVVINNEDLSAEQVVEKIISFVSAR